MWKKGKSSSSSSSSKGNKANKSHTSAADDETPGNGWIFEKDEAAKAVKCERNGQNIFRLARAYHKLRQWKKLENITSPTVLDETIPIISNKSSTDPDDNDNDNGNTNSSSFKFYRKQLTVWHKEARDNLSQNSLLTDKLGKQLRFIDINNRYIEDDQYNKFNMLHSAANRGDIRLLEKAVALGAAIDYPVGNLHEKVTSNTEAAAPRDATALLLACSELATFGSSSQDQKRKILRFEPALAGIQRGTLECAIQLVKLGADCNMVYKEKNKDLQSFNLDNKNAYQLAKISKISELIRVMENFRSNEDKIRLVHCRCGSRLPWKDCHGAAPCGSVQIPCYYYNNNDSENTSGLNWRYSPLANCPCGYNDVDYYKQHIKCCWSVDTQHNYRNDYNGEFCRTRLKQITR